MIALVDYGAGNLTSVQKGLAAAGGGVIVARSPANLANAAGVVVPGVGHFAATASLDDTWRAAILEGIGRGRPLLGICLGMQWLFEGSTEAPGCPGLGVLEGRCARLEDRAGTLKIPHVGWNALDFTCGANPSGSPGEPERLAPLELAPLSSSLATAIGSSAGVFFGSRSPVVFAP